MPRIRAASIAEHKVITRALILEMAQELFATWGYEDTSFGDIATAVGIGRTTLYDYFTDKDDLLASLVEETLPPTIRRMVEQLPQDIPPAERLRHLVIRMVEFVALEPTLGLLLHREVPKLSASAQKRVANAHQSLAREFIDTYRAGVAAGDLKRLPPGIAGRFLNDMTMSAARVLIDSENPTEALPTIAEVMADLLFDGLATRPVGQTSGNELADRWRTGAGGSRW